MSASQLGLFLMVACVVAIVSRRLKLPYSVGLVAAGAGLAMFGKSISLTVAPDFVYTILLPPLIFEAALHLKWRPFRADLPVTLLLAFPGVAISGAIIAVGMHVGIGWGWLGAALFGALIAATDPVAVVAAFKDLRVEPRLSLLVESESLLNDGAAAVAFAVLLSVAHGAQLEPVKIAGALVWMAGGGVAVGVLTALTALLVAGRTQDHLVEVTLTTIAAYGSFWMAEHLHMSGVLAALAAGLVVGNLGRTGWMGGAISRSGQAHLITFWDYAAFLCNSVVFIVIGAHEAMRGAGLLIPAAWLAIGLVLLARIATVYPLCAAFLKTRLKVDLRHQHVLVWGGLKGALALALALAVPDDVPEKEGIIIAAFAVVAFSLFVQGLTMPWLIGVLDLKAKRPGDDAP